MVDRTGRQLSTVYGQLFLLLSNIYRQLLCLLSIVLSIVYCLLSTVKCQVFFLLSTVTNRPGTLVEHHVSYSCQSKNKCVCSIFEFGVIIFYVFLLLVCQFLTEFLHQIFPHRSSPAGKPTLSRQVIVKHPSLSCLHIASFSS